MLKECIVQDGGNEAPPEKREKCQKILKVVAVVVWDVLNHSEKLIGERMGMDMLRITFY